LIFGFREIGSAIELWIVVEPTPSQKTIASKIKIYFIFDIFFHYEAEEKFQKYLIYFILSVIYLHFFSF